MAENEKKFGIHIENLTEEQALEIMDALLVLGYVQALEKKILNYGGVY